MAGLAVCALLLSGCSYQIANLRMLSPHAGVPAHVADGPRVSGQDCAWVVLIPLGLPHLQDAINNALAKAGPQYDALVDVSVYFDNEAFRIGRRCYRVEGTAIDTRSAASQPHGKR